VWYNIALFVHVLGVIALFVAVSLIVVAFMRMRRSSTANQAREWASIAQGAGKSIAFIAIVILAPALYMVAAAWNFTTPWVMTSFIAFVALAIIGATVNGRAIERVAATTRSAELGAIPETLRAQLTAPQLWLLEGARLSLLVGIVFLMTVKPDLPGSLFALGVTLTLGLILGALAQRVFRPRPRKEKLA